MERQVNQSGSNNIPDGISFRTYQDTDMARIVGFAVQSWHMKSDTVSDRAEAAVMNEYVGLALPVSNWREVACRDGVVIGAAFGMISRAFRQKSFLSAARTELALPRRLLIDERYRIPRRYRAILSYILTELKLALNIAGYDAVLTLLLVDEGHRGRGIGRALTDRFVRAAKETGGRRAMVYTDDVASNWRFYENYGFRKVSVFRDNWSGYYNGTKTKGIIYDLQLK